MYEDRNARGRFTINEEWEDQAALDAHLASAHVQAVFGDIAALKGEIDNICASLSEVGLKPASLA